jgi:hypothetical protein
MACAAADADGAHDDGTGDDRGDARFRPKPAAGEGERLGPQFRSQCPHELSDINLHYELFRDPAISEYKLYQHRAPLLVGAPAPIQIRQNEQNQIENPPNPTENFLET